MYANQANQGVGGYGNPNALQAQAAQIQAVPREPSLSEKVQQISQRAGSINMALDSLEQHMARLFGESLPGQANKQSNDPGAPIANIDTHLAYCGQHFALIEGRIATLIALLEHRL